MVMMFAFQANDPGSIPGERKRIIIYKKIYNYYIYNLIFVLDTMYFIKYFFIVHI